MPIIPGRPLEVRRHQISDAEWDLIQPHLPGRVADPGRTAPGPSWLYQRSPMDGPHGGAVAGPAGAFGAMEFRVPAVQLASLRVASWRPVVQTGELGAAPAHLAGAGLGVPEARLACHPGPPAAGVRKKRARGRLSGVCAEASAPSCTFCTLPYKRRGVPWNGSWAPAKPTL